MDDAGAAGVAAGSDSAAATDYGHGLDIPLSDRELSFLREAGINPRMLNNMDRAAVIRALWSDNTLIEDTRAGNAGTASILYSTGNLRNELSHTKQEIEEEQGAGKLDDISAADLDEEEKQMLLAGATKAAVLDHIRKRKAEEAHLKNEYAALTMMGSEAYVAANPIPSEALEKIFGDGEDARQLAKDGKGSESKLPAGLENAAFLSSLRNLNIAVSNVADNDPTHLSAQRTGKGQKVEHEIMPLGGYDPAAKKS